MKTNDIKMVNKSIEIIEKALEDLKIGMGLDWCKENLIIDYDLSDINTITLKLKD